MTIIERATPGEAMPDLPALFHQTFPHSRSELAIGYAPGRVNLIGEHTDYNDGFVLPVAVDRGAWVLGQRRSDRRVDLYAANYDARASFDLDALRYATTQSWINYPQGVADALQRAGHRLVGMNLVLWGNVPPAAGMSSSAAIEIACMQVFTHLADLTVDPVDEALLAQQAENRFVGVQTGIMDQFISRLGVADHALLIDCRSLAYRPIAMTLPGVVLGVVHSGVPRGLAGSAYNDRRAECAEGVRLLQARQPAIRALRDLQPADLALLDEHLPEPIRQRCRHIVTENARVGLAANALRHGDTALLGQLFAASQESMRDDYAISHPAVDTLVTLARSHGSLASRMTGGGFGGCTVNLVPEERWSGFVSGIMDEYPRRSGHTPTVWRCAVTGGAALEVRAPG